MFGFSGNFFFTENQNFLTLESLVKYYRKEGQGFLKAQLKDGCQIIPPLNNEKFKVSLKIKKNPELWITPNSAIQIGDRLGGGNYGEVFKGSLRGTMEVAVKTLILKDKSKEKKEEFEKETEVMKILNL